MEEPQPTNSKLSQNQIIGIVIAVLVVLVGIYWFAVRPYYVRKDCSTTAFNEVRLRTPSLTNSEILSDGDIVTQNYYNFDSACLSSHGL